MTTSPFPILGLTLLIGAVPVLFASSTAMATADIATEMRVEQVTKNARSNANATPNVNVRSAETVAEKAQQFTANKLRICNQNQDKLKARMQQISDRGVKQLDVFRKIADRTKAYYVAKGYSIEGYSILATELDDQYNQSVAAVYATQSSQNTWGCDDSNPLSAMQGFTTAKKNEIATLQAYKDKVRELILLVKQAGGDR